MLINYIFKNIPGFHNCRTKVGLKGILSLMVLFIFTDIQSQTTYTSVQSGNYTDPLTWGTETAPTPDDNVIISTGTTVSLSDWLTVQNVTINGTLESTAASWEFIVNGNLTVNSGGLFKGYYFFDAGSFGYNKGIQLSIAGNIINNGRIDLSEGSSYNPEGVLNLNGTTLQTVSGLGTFGGTSYNTSSSNNGAVINQLVVNNTSPTTPNVIWGFNNIKIKSVLTLTNARVDLGSNKMSVGNYGSAALVCPAGNGFLSGTIGRWYDAYDNYDPIASGADYYNIKALFPFISANGKSRAAFITRPNDSTFSAISGQLSVSYYDASTVSPGFTIADGAYTVTDIYEGTWVVEKDATYSFPVGNHTLAFSLEDAYLIKNGNSRIIKADGTTIGVHQTGTTTPFAERTDLSDTDLDNIFQVGYNAALDTPVTSLQSGNWNDAAVWSSNSVPTCTDTVTILSGHTITVDTNSNAAGINISVGGALISNASSLTVGCTNNNATFSNRGTYAINGGSLIVNGNVFHANGSSFNQTGGDIIVDGNHNGATATSSDQTLFKIGNSTLNLTGGKITIIDPPVVNTTLVTTHEATSVIPCTGFFCWYTSSVQLDSVDGLAVGQIVVGTGIPAGTTIANINFDGTINTNPSLPETGLNLPLSLSFYNTGNTVSAFVYDSNTNYAAGLGHTLQIGDGISTEKSTVTTNGFNCNFRTADGALSLGNLTVNALDPTNRFMNLDNNNSNFSTVVMNVQNDFKILQGKVKGNGVDTYYGGNVLNNGELNVYNSTYLGNYINGSYVETTNPQTISGNGTFNAQSDVILNNSFNTGSVNQLKVNNTSTSGVTFTIPFNVVSGLNMTAGIIHMGTNILKIGTPAMAYTAFIDGNFGSTCYVDGPMSKDIGSGQNAIDLTNGSGFDSAFFFPVGKESYAPIWVGVTTPSGGFNSPGTNLKVEAFGTNSGTPSANIAHLSQNRWEVYKTDGTVINFNIKVSDSEAGENSIIVQAPAAAGVYDNDFGITSTFTAGTPNTLASTSAPLDFTAFKGFFSTARQAECSIVNPGNTIATRTNVCNGQSSTLSLQNVVIGEGISYQWQSSASGLSYDDIDGATATSCVVTPLENTYYRCNVSCSFSSATVASTPVSITLNNSIDSTIPATICLLNTDTATLSAASTATVKWYDAPSGGTTLATGNTFITPSISTTTTYYVGTETTSNTTAGMSYSGDGYPSGGTNKGLSFNLNNSIILNSVKVYPNQSPGGSGVAPITIRIFQNGIPVPGTAAVTFTPNSFSDYSPSTTAQTVILNYELAAGENYSLQVTDGTSYDNALAYNSFFPSPFPMENGPVMIIGGIDNDYTDIYSYNYFYDWDITEVCSSARVAVTATVLTENCDLHTPTLSESLSNVMAYPNPYEKTFQINLLSYNNSDIHIQVYDMLGRLIEQREISLEELTKTQLGLGYPTGVYNVIVRQENEVKTLRIIKQ
ncbi:T9SS type A sorting domain-containing protein [Flavobacterium sp. XGLA_31]|uniref:Ig-like domain-containing protein n=1 Tax=Flavobacterium sp. XGLA_31 TaxID=3447666 RepID=UPI003F2A2D19